MDIYDTRRNEIIQEQEATIQKLKERLPMWADRLEENSGIWLVRSNNGEAERVAVFKQAIKEMHQTAESL